MAAALRVVLLALAAGAAALPAAVRLRTGDPAHHHRYHERSRRLLYIEGEWPSKTRLGVFDAATGKARSFHFAEQRLTGEFACLADCGQALVASLDRAGDGLAPRLLRVDLEDGALLGRVPLGGDASLVGFGGPAGSRAAYLVLTARGRTFLRTLDAASGTLGEARPLGGFLARTAVFDETGPWALLDVSEKGASRLLVVDLAAGAVRREVPGPYGFETVAAGPGGLVATARPPADAATVLYKLDPAQGAARELGRVEGEVESVLAAGGRVYAVAKDPAGAAADPDKDLRPRILAVLGEGAPPETLPWTARKGALVGFSAQTGKLYFAATQPMSSWELPADAAGLAAAAKELDRRTGEFWGAGWESWFLGLLGAAVLLGIVMAIVMRPACKSCR